ncbi:MAG: zf-HC2 domain-containing protein [Oscillospiraceae bacterium]|nr:zf-HC2 domain-containing protein [Oscillospiraceae bacterium]
MDKKYNELDCDIVRDLLPLYYDDVVSEATKGAVAQHISSCDKCRNELKEMQTDLPCDESSALVTQKQFADMMRSQKRRRILWTAISVAAFIALMVGAYFSQLQVPIIDVPDEEITLHRVYQYKTEDGYKFFLLYSAPFYDYMYLGTDVESDGTTLVFQLKKPLITKKHEGMGSYNDATIYSCGWESGDDGGREFHTFEEVKFGNRVVWTKEDAENSVPDYVYAYEEIMYQCSGKVSGWVSDLENGYVGASYSDGKTVLWDLDGNVIHSS